MMADLHSLIVQEIPKGRQDLIDSHTNLERVAEYCEGNYINSENRRGALEETKNFTTQSLASVAYQINTLAYNFIQMLDLQQQQISDMGSQITNIAQTVMVHKEKVARREIGVLTTNKSSNRQFKIIAPVNPERPIKYVRKPIDFGALDDIGHGVRVHSQGPAGMPRPVRQNSTSSQGPPPPESQPPAAAAAGGHYRPGYQQQQSVVTDDSLPGWVPKDYIEKVVAVYDYAADKEDELSFSENSVIYVLKRNDDGWWEGVMDGVTGLFPGNYVEPLMS